MTLRTRMLTLAFAVLALALAATGCGEKRAAEEADQTLPPQVALYGVRLTSWEGSQVVARGQAAKVTYDRPTGRFDAYEARVRFPDTAMGVLDVSAPLANGNLQQKLAHASGGVLGKASNGLTAFAPSATFDGVGFVAEGKEGVDVKGPGYSVRANGFTFYLATEELIFDGDVDSRLGQAEGGR